jgi:PadR family transcriptional regulator, regulatory protein PadR
MAKDGLTRMPRQTKYKVMQNIGGDMLRGHLDTLVLSVLEQGQAHGLEIIRRLHESGCGALRLKEGSLYPALYRLENAGLVEATWEEETKGRRGARRRIYRLTAKGTKALDQGRQVWQHFVKVIGGILGAPV